LLKIHHINCATLCPSGGSLISGKGNIFSKAHMVCHCLLIETNDGLALVDTGLGMLDITMKNRLDKGFKMFAKPALKETETAIAQVKALGFSADDVRHIIPTHLDVDHTGGLADFPKAKVHIFKDEYEAAMKPKTYNEKHRYNQLHWQHKPDWEVYNVDGSKWFDFDCVRDLKGLPEDILLVPVTGHTRGHCAVAVNTTEGWQLHAGDAYFYHGEIDGDKRSCPLGIDIFQRLMQVVPEQRVHNQDRLRKLMQEHGKEITIFSAHDPVELEKMSKK
jgi:glyoxylase-like metal-dependent hydrolase (beta-lactamase superfamily II)